MCFIIFFWLYVKVSENTDLTYQRNRELILNRAKYYYENDKERLIEKAKDKYRKLSKQDKNKKTGIWEE